MLIFDLKRCGCRLACALLMAASGAALAEDSVAQASSVASPAVETSPAATVDPSEPAPKSFGELPDHFGSLSDPNVPPSDIFEAIVGGKVLFDNRFRVEHVHQDGVSDSTAVTNRLRLGYQTRSYHGLSALVEMENVSTPNENDYFVPATGSGTPGKAVIADPSGTEVNQAYLRYHNEELDLGGRIISVDFKGGRQRIILDDSRFVGNVGWRQFEQTFDAVSFKTNLGIEKLSVYYAYVWRVQRIFGPDGPNWDSDSHLVHVSYEVMPELKVTPMAYILAFDNAGANSTATYGVRLSGNIDLEKYCQLVGTQGKYELTYARQTSYSNNPVNYQADFVAADLSVTQKGMGTVGAGYQFLGSDGGAAGFAFPLATNHKFNGWADVFLTTPAAGLQDLYGYVGTPLPWDVKGKMVIHKFWSDVAGLDYGWELDAQLKKKITENWSVLAKAAWYQGNSGSLGDRNKVWVETTFKF